MNTIEVLQSIAEECREELELNGNRLQKDGDPLISARDFSVKEAVIRVTATEEERAQRKKILKLLNQLETARRELAQTTDEANNALHLLRRMRYSESLPADPGFFYQSSIAELAAAEATKYNLYYYLLKTATDPHNAPNDFAMSGRATMTGTDSWKE